MYQRKPNNPQVSLLARISIFIVLSITPISLLAANSVPTIVSLSPTSGAYQPGATVKFTTVFSDANGWQNIQYCYFLINTSTGGANCFYGYYNQNTNKFYIRNDTNSAWLGGFTPGSGNTIQNACAKLNCLSSSISGSGSILTITWSITFNTPFASHTGKACYLYVRDDSNAYAGLTKKGTAIIDISPEIGALTPTSGVYDSDTQLNIVSEYTDTHGYQYLANAYCQFGTSRCYTYYNRASNKLYIINDAGTAFIGGCTPGSAGVLENSYVKLDCVNTKIAYSGTKLTITWAFTLKEPLTTAVYPLNLYALNTTNLSSGWINKGEACLTRQPTAPKD